MQGSERVIAFWLFVCVALVLGGDVVGDVRAGSPLFHWITESFLAVAALIGALWLGYRHVALRVELIAAKKGLASAHDEVARYRSESMQHMRGGVVSD